MAGTSQWLFQDAPTMLAELDAQLVCRLVQPVPVHLVKVFERSTDSNAS